MSNTLFTIGACERSSYNGQPSTSWPIFDATGKMVGEIQGEYDDDRTDRQRFVSSECKWRVSDYTVSFWDQYATFPSVEFTVDRHDSARAALSAAKAFAKNPGPYAVR